MSSARPPTEQPVEFHSDSGVRIRILEHHRRAGFELLALAKDGLRSFLRVSADDLLALGRMLVRASESVPAERPAAAANAVAAVAAISPARMIEQGARSELDLAFRPVSQQRIACKNGETVWVDPWDDGSRIVLRCHHPDGLDCVLPLAPEEAKALGRHLQAACQPRLGIPAPGSEHPLQLFGLHLDLRHELRELATLLLQYRAETTAATLTEAETRLGTLQRALRILLPLTQTADLDGEAAAAVAEATSLLEAIDAEEAEHREWWRDD